MIWGLILAAAALVWFCYDIPNPVREAAVTRRPSITLLAADGTEIGTWGDLHGDVLRIGDLPRHLIDAILATEDRRFYSHFGLDLVGIARAAAANLRAGHVVQGGSTITQQVAKNLFLTHERTFRRKVQEFVLSLWLERIFTKDQILMLYVNRVYLGGGTYGVDAASRRYFQRPARAVTVYQAAMVAGLPKAPSRYNPHADPKAAHTRAREVIGKMVEAGSLTRRAAEAALATAPTAVQPSTRSAASGYFADWILEQVGDYANIRDQDLVVRTTLVPGLQRAAEEALEGVLAEKGAASRVSQGAVVALDGAGAVQAMVGGRSHARAPFNRAAHAYRQPGSAFKPFVFLAGLEAGLSPDSILEDTPVAIGSWRPGNYGGRYRGPITMQEALAHSSNAVAVRISEQAGRMAVAGVARRFGIGPAGAVRPSIALGVFETTPLALAGAYVPFMNGGLRARPWGIVSIATRDGRLVYRRSVPTAHRIVDPGHAESLRRMLAAVVSWGTGRNAALPGEAVYGKTGTSQNYRDAWFAGFVPGRVAVVWLGNDDSSPMRDVTGGALPAEVWRRFMERTLPRPAP
ncbi:transglycosylase domain-containing protein [Phaeovibrio sulfidiphilus]|nr:PBP1A family penicillin-binding protein [Phaeovibrio sulfidiphilus]